MEPCVLDYKTGAPPTASRCAWAVAAADADSCDAARGRFRGIAAGASVCELGYVRLSGNIRREESIVELTPTRDRRIYADEAAEEAREKLKN